MPIRFRQRHDPGNIGFFHDRYTDDARGYHSWDEWVEDEVPSWDGGFFFVRKRTIQGGLMNGMESPSSFWQSKAFDYPVINRNTFPTIGIPSWRRPPDVVLAAKLLANTNPSRPKQDLPSVVGEFFSDGLPSLKKRGDSLLQQFGNAYLSGAFGFAPLINDVITATKFAENVDKRLRTLNNLRKNGKLSYTQDLWSDSYSQRDLGYAMNSAPWVVADVYQSATIATRGHVKWFPTDSFPTADPDLMALAVTSSLGLYHSFSSFWEVMPWSWLIDYVANVGDVLNAMRNVCNLSHSIPQIMNHVKIVSHAHTVYFDGWNNSDPTINTYEGKDRASVSGSLSASIPILSSGQWSILGALSASKFG